MTRYVSVQLFKMVSFPHKSDPIQTLRAEDGFDLKREPGDCIIMATHRDGWTDDIPMANVARARRLIERPADSSRPFARAAEILKETPDAKKGEQQKDHQQKHRDGDKGRKA